MMKWAYFWVGLFVVGCAPALSTPEVGTPTQSRLVASWSQPPTQTNVMLLSLQKEEVLDDADRKIAEELLLSSLERSGYFAVLTNEKLKSLLAQPNMVGKIPNAKFIVSGSVEAIEVTSELVSKLRHRTKITYTAKVYLSLVSIETGQITQKTTQTATLVAITNTAAPDEKLQTAALRDAIDQAVRTLAGRL